MFKDLCLILADSRNQTVSDQHKTWATLQTGTGRRLNPNNLVFKTVHFRDQGNIYFHFIQHDAGEDFNEMEMITNVSNDFDVNTANFAELYSWFDRNQSQEIQVCRLIGENKGTTMTKAFLKGFFLAAFSNKTTFDL